MAAPEAEPLLPVDASSRDLEADAPSSPAPAPMRRFTGTFDDPSLEAAFASAAFREAFAVHVGLMAMAAAASGAIFGANRDTIALIGAVLLLLTVVLRVYLHQHKDPHTAQKLGAASWTIIVVIALLSDLANATREGRAKCAEDTVLPVITVLYSSIAMINGSHGMRFWHKTGTAALLTVDALICSRSCSESPGYAIIVALVLSSFLVGHAVSHSLEYARRRSYLLHEQKTISCERSKFDIALLGADVARLRRQNEWLQTPASEAGPSGLRPPSRALSSVSSGSSFDREPEMRPRNEAEAARLAAKRQACADRQLARQRRREWSRVRLFWIGLNDPGSTLHALRAPDLVELISDHILRDLRPPTTLPAPPAQPEPPSPPRARQTVPLFLRGLAFGLP